MVQELPRCPECGGEATRYFEYVGRSLPLLRAERRVDGTLLVVVDAEDGEFFHEDTTQEGFLCSNDGSTWVPSEAERVLFEFE